MRAGLALAAALLTALAAPREPAAAQETARFAADILHQRQPGDTVALTRGEVVGGLREALTLAAGEAVRRLAAHDGFMGDARIRISLPGPLGEAHSRLRPFGMAGPLDELETSLNRAAETAVGRMQPALDESIAGLAIADPLAVLRGGETAATETLRAEAGEALDEALRPIMAQVMEETRVSVALEAAATRYAPALLRTDMQDMLVRHATGGALDGLFYYVAQEEQAIRRDPEKGSSDILRRVFGG